MSMKFDWTPRTIGEWRELLLASPRSNWMQTWPYAQASFRRDFRSSKLAVIQKDGVTCGMMSVQEIKLGPLHFIELHRGPLFFHENPPLELFKEFAELFRKTYPESLFRRVRYLPEWENKEEAARIMLDAGFRRTPQTYSTIWVDLRTSLENIRLRFKQKWRNSLNKSERSGLEVKMDPRGSGIDLFLKKYDEHKKNKGFTGPSAAFLKEEYLAALKVGDAFTLWAKYKDQIVAGVLIALHGKTASYRCGWNTDLGRETNAHYLLLWKAIQLLHEKSFHKLDLGGVKPDEDPGVTKFKRGLGGDDFEFLGIWK